MKAWTVYAQHHSGQSCERIAERGGFGIEELIYLLAGENPWSMPARNDGPLQSDFFNRWPEDQKPERSGGL